MRVSSPQGQTPEGVTTFATLIVGRVRGSETRESFVLAGPPPEGVTTFATLIVGRIRGRPKRWSGGFSRFRLAHGDTRRKHGISRTNPVPQRRIRAHLREQSESAPGTSLTAKSKTKEWRTKEFKPIPLSSIPLSFPEDVTTFATLLFGRIRRSEARESFVSAGPPPEGVTTFATLLSMRLRTLSPADNYQVRRKTSSPSTRVKCASPVASLMEPSRATAAIQVSFSGMR